MNTSYLDASRSLFTLFADDVRQEVGNKLTIVGVYQSQMLVPAFPLTLPKLAVVMTATTPGNEPFEAISFQVLRDDTLLQEARFNPEDSQEPFGPASDEALRVQCVAVLGPLQIEGPCTLLTRLQTADGYLHGASLQIRLAVTRQTTH